MKTYLIFKRQENRDGTLKVVTKLVPVDIPQISSGEGWMLSGHTDIIDVVPEECQEQSKEEIPSKKLSGDKFESNVKGTAKLVRSGGIIKIVARRGKTTYNQNTPNGVCISDEVKNKFFDSCRECHGTTAGIYYFRLQDKFYDMWNSYIDAEYQRQRADYKKRTEGV